MKTLSNVGIVITSFGEGREGERFVNKPEWTSGGLANDFPEVVKDTTVTGGFVDFHVVFV